MKLLELIQDSRGQLSSKRIFSLVAGFMVILSAIMNLFFNVTPAEFIFKGLMYIATVGILGVTAEVFSGAWSKFADKAVGGSDDCGDKKSDQ